MNKKGLKKIPNFANEKDMPYQTLIKQYIEQGLEKDFWQTLRA